MNFERCVAIADDDPRLAGCLPKEGRLIEGVFYVPESSWFEFCALIALKVGGEDMEKEFKRLATH